MVEAVKDAVIDMDGQQDPVKAPSPTINLHRRRLCNKRSKRLLLWDYKRLCLFESRFAETNGANISAAASATSAGQNINDSTLYL